MSDFKWADSQNANTKEPITALKENGWQYADVPTASNFNWLFNQIQKELEGVKAELKAIKESTDRIESIANIANRALDKSILNRLDLNITHTAARSICMYLRAMEADIRTYHPDFPTKPWPLNDRSNLERRPHLMESTENVE